MLEKPDCGFCTVRNIDLAIDIFQMVADRVFADAKLDGNFGVWQSAGGVR